MDLTAEEKRHLVTFLSAELLSALEEPWDWVAINAKGFLFLSPRQAAGTFMLVTNYIIIIYFKKKHFSHTNEIHSALFLRYHVFRDGLDISCQVIMLVLSNTLTWILRNYHRKLQFQQYTYDNFQF
jgi:hypothetical protein